MTFVEVEPLAEYVVRTFTLERVRYCLNLLYSMASIFSNPEGNTFNTQRIWTLRSQTWLDDESVSVFIHACTLKQSLWWCLVDEWSQLCPSVQAEEPQHCPQTTNMHEVTQHWLSSCYTASVGAVLQTPLNTPVCLSLHLLWYTWPWSTKPVLSVHLWKLRFICYQLAE